MASRPFYVVIPIVMTASGENTGEYDVGQSNKLTIKRILQKASDTVDIIQLSDSFGNNFGNISSAYPMDINVFCDISSDNNVPAELPDDIIISGNGKIVIKCKDTSGNGATAYFYLFGYLEN